ncbi:hypothetical protein [Pseudoteredinibacter isoporae]|uniref:Chromosome segregation ATPase n=1 Tax=Pseudoteredinibacter isoporae TaxID=570281 RepID=A0A7X0MVB8_9GAMM|nr:hypothetical protein [Pseudoteredinibacter isoporae]MBB6520935.1 chromosome segregation ATPase [Pseudoteredinibacter isoporae]NHO86500.1 hypothetical protein [Pseudoteredinibacter isoporae]NIB25048.1 hypothetical protein [Pseudoteredinibacter isoporae]
MSVERREPTFGDVGSTEPETSTGQQAAAPEPRAYAHPPASPQARQGSSVSWLAVFAFLLALAAGAAAGYLYWQGQLEKQASQAAMSAAEDRIAALEQKLDFSNEESNQSVEAIRAKMKWADSEIRKLWGVAYDRNRKTIDQHKKQLASLDKKLKSAASNASKAATTSAAQADSISKLQSSNEAQETRLTQAESTLQQRAKDLQNALNDLEAQALQLDQLRNGILERVKQNEEAIESITVYRKTTNRELLNIKKRLDSVQGGTKPAA